MKSITAICIGASAGALLRWILALALNSIYPALPLGTLSANILGGYLIGFVIGFFEFFPGISPEWRLLAVTGFLGGLTTFSTFSLEAVALIRESRLVDALIHVIAHVAGSLSFTFLGFASFDFLRKTYF